MISANRFLCSFFIGLVLIFVNILGVAQSVITGGHQPKKVNTLLGINSGVYQEFSIAIDSIGQLTGVYEYYGRWDEKAKEFLDINLLYFIGHITQDSIAKINGGWPESDQKLKGQLKFVSIGAQSEFEINLDKEPNGYNDVSFRKGIIRTLNVPKKWLEIGIVKSAKAHIFSQPDSLTIRIGYLIKNDIVKVITFSNGNWLQVEYNPPGNKNKASVFWIRSDDLYESDPTKW